MKILIIFNRYRYYGGEIAYVESVTKLLKEKGHEVFSYTKDSSNVDISTASRILISKDLFYSKKVDRELKEIITRIKPDVAYIQNIFPLINFQAYYTCKRFNIPIVQRMSSYRFMCPKMTLFRDNKICMDCVGKNFFYPAILHKCYNNSRLGSLMFSLSFYYHKLIKTYNLIDLMVFPSEFIRDFYIQHADIRREKTKVIPTFYKEPQNLEKTKNPVFKKNYFLFFGRFSEEKGILELLQLFKVNPNYKLKVVGDGPLIGEVKRYNKYPNIKIIGFLKRERLYKYIQEALFTIIPSKGYDVLPNALIESYANRTGVIAPDRGSFPELISQGKTGYLFSDRSSSKFNLIKIIKKVSDDKNLAYKIGLNARSQFTFKYTGDIHYENLLKAFNMLLRAA